MTSLATMLGALPIAMALGAGSKSRMGMGIVIIGGLMLSMVLTLFVIPAIYSFLVKDKKQAEGTVLINDKNQDKDAV
jgi:multidrug efflux pump